MPTYLLAATCNKNCMFVFQRQQGSHFFLTIFKIKEINQLH